MAVKKGKVQLARGGVMGGLDASESKTKPEKKVGKEREPRKDSGAEDEEGGLASQLTVDLTGTEIDRLLRLKEVLQYIPVGRSTWWSGVKSGRYPAPIKLGPRTTTWTLSSILQLMNQKEGNNHE